MTERVARHFDYAPIDFKGDFLHRGRWRLLVNIGGGSGHILSLRDRWRVKIDLTTKIFVRHSPPIF